jgi:hypothetical protein
MQPIKIPQRHDGVAGGVIKAVYIAYKLHDFTALLLTHPLKAENSGGVLPRMRKKSSTNAQLMRLLFTLCKPISTNDANKGKYSSDRNVLKKQEFKGGSC